MHRDRRGWYRFHPFLRQVLLAELHREVAAEVPVLYSRAARWAAGQGDVIEALRCVAEAQEWGGTHAQPVLKALRTHAERELDQRWARNVMLNKWLEYCVERGHRFSSATKLAAAI